MAYQALYRTYRPSSFDEVVGQEYIVTTLKNAVKNGKIAHAYLFCGPRGTGKTSIARILAKAVNCEEEDKPCNHCASCKMIEEGTHPDVIEIDGASYGNVENTREIIDKVKYAPLQGKYKIYIIDEVHMLSSSAFNSLLKTLEEPPSHAIFILATTDPQKVLPTIVSRCQRFDFGKVKRNDIAERIKYILKNEKITYEDAAVEEIAFLADGGMRDALSILDQVIAYAQDNVSLKDVYTIYGVTTPTTKYQLLKEVCDKNVKESLNISTTLIESGTDIKRLTNDLIEILKECVIYEATREADFLNSIELDHVQDMICKTDAKNLLAMIDVLNEARSQYRYASDIYSVFEVAILKMIYVSEVKENKEELPLISSTTKPKIEKEEKKTVVKEEKKPAEVFETEYLLKLLVGADRESRMAVSNQWGNIDNYLFNENVAKYFLQLKSSVVGAVGKDYIVVHTKYSSGAEVLNESNQELAFTEAIQSALHRNYRIVAITDDEYQKLIEEFKLRQKNNTLPKAEEKEEVSEEKEKDETEKKLEELFGKGSFKVIEE